MKTRVASAVALTALLIGLGVASSLSDWHFRRGLAAPRAILANYDVLRGWIGSIRG
jgi:hypothetical protein